MWYIHVVLRTHKFRLLLYLNYLIPMQSSNRENPLHRGEKQKEKHSGVRSSSDRLSATSPVLCNTYNYFNGARKFPIIMTWENQCWDFDFNQFFQVLTLINNKFKKTVPRPSTVWGHLTSYSTLVFTAVRSAIWESMVWDRGLK